MEITTLQIKGTEDTPEIGYNHETNEFIISGRSLPEDVSSFYQPTFEWLDKYAMTAGLATTFKFKLEYFNTASSKIILDILMRLEEINLAGENKANVEWHFMDGDDDMSEAGEEYKELVEIPFNLINY
jgi:hypothetical protein